MKILLNKVKTKLRFRTIIGKSKQIEQRGTPSQSPKTHRFVKIITAVALHIILHIISIHLAAAYTIYHIVQHRHEISSFFKKLSFKSDANHSRTGQAVQLTA